MSVTKLAQGGSSLSGGAFDKKGIFHLCDSQTGSVYRVEDGELVEVLNTHGQPTAVGFDPISGAMYICDMAHQAILRVEGFGEDGSSPVLSEVVKEYNRQALKGPSGLAFSKDGGLLFTDSGNLGSTTLGSTGGSAFGIPSGASQPVLQPLALNSLAHAWGICLSSNHRNVFVCEMLQNRLLRFSQRPSGVYHGSVFHYFSGGMGPSLVACDPSAEGNLYVARFDFRGNTDKGLITILRPQTGELVSELSLPGPEITGLALHPHNPKLLYVTEASQSSVYVYSLP